MLIKINITKKWLYALVFLLVFLHTAESKSQISVGEIKLIQEIGEGYEPQFVPGSYSIVFTGRNQKGLWLFNAESKTINNITADAGAGFEPQFSDNGKQIIFKSYRMSENGQRISDIIASDIQTGAKTIMETNLRNASSTKVVRNQIFYTSNTEIQSINIQSRLKNMPENNTIVALTDDQLNLVVLKDGRKQILNPLGTAYYIWVSVSPDGNRILYNVPGKGSFICDLEGNNLFEIGKLNAPRWSSDGKFIVGMDDIDDGTKFTSSEIVIFSLSDNKKTILSEKAGIIALNPDLSYDGKKIVFNNEKGEIFIMNLN